MVLVPDRLSGAHRVYPPRTKVTPVTTTSGAEHRQTKAHGDVDVATPFRVEVVSRYTHPKPKADVADPLPHPVGFPSRVNPDPSFHGSHPRQLREIPTYAAPLRFEGYGARIEIIYLEPALETTLARNSRRQNPVPTQVILHLADRLEPPAAAECHGLTLVGDPSHDAAANRDHRT